MNYPDDNHNKAIVNTTEVINSSTDKYDGIEFDLNDKASYDALVSKYTNAWKEYYPTESVAPAYSAENAKKLKLAISFYLYTHAGDETYSRVTTEESLDWSPYAQEEGSGVQTLANPNAVSDMDVYSTVVSGGALPKVQMDGERVVSTRSDSGRNVAQLYSNAQNSMTEYETTRAQPTSAYDWGGAYATGKRTY